MMLAKIGEKYVMARRVGTGRWEVRECGIVRVMRVQRVQWIGFPGSKLPVLS